MTRFPEPDAGAREVLERAIETIPEYLAAAIEAVSARLAGNSTKADGDAAMDDLIADLEAELRRRAH
jgi:hypothetical protein